MDQERHAAARAVLAYIQEEFDCEPEFLWARTPGNGVLRCRENGRWFAALLTDIPCRVLGLPGDGTLDLLNLKCDPMMLGALVDGERYLPGYHMNKEHWVSAVLGRVPLEELAPLIAESRRLVTGGAHRKKGSRRSGK